MPQFFRNVCAEALFLGIYFIRGCRACFAGEQARFPINRFLENRRFRKDGGRGERGITWETLSRTVRTPGGIRRDNRFFGYMQADNA